MKRRRLFSRNISHSFIITSKKNLTTALVIAPSIGLTASLYNMSATASPMEPFPISCISGRYLIFDIDVVTHLRRSHNICGVFIGGIPQVPQQNVFLGLPLELIPEEARVLVEKNAAYLVDDPAFHKSKLGAFHSDDRDRKLYIESLRAEGLKSRNTAEGLRQKSAERGLAKEAAKRAQRQSASAEAPAPTETSAAAAADEADPETVLFQARVASPVPSSTAGSVAASAKPDAVTLTSSYPPMSLPDKDPSRRLPSVPSSYPLFAYLHSRGYFMTPGLRFGCQYSVYPGDPLRFHSHFLAVGLGWKDEIPLLDIVGGGRLGTGVKKGFLIGGEDASPDSNGEVRSFCIEWGGM